MIKTIVAITAVAMIGYMTSSAGLVNWQEYDEALVAQAASERTTVIYFTATTWCPTCVVVDRTVLKNPEAYERLNEFPIFKLNMDNHEPWMWKLLSKYKSYGIPTMVVLYPDGTFKTLVVPTTKEILKYVVDR